jgi:hypothetical protein
MVFRKTRANDLYALLDDLILRPPRQFQGIGPNPLTPSNDDLTLSLSTNVCNGANTLTV